MKWVYRFSEEYPAAAVHSECQYGKGFQGINTWELKKKKNNLLQRGDDILPDVYFFPCCSGM
jgi:hypothetical protein